MTPSRFAGAYARAVLFRPTAKLLKLFGKPWTGQLVEAEPSDEDWYGNLLWIDSRKCVLLTHAGTMFSVFVSDIAVADLRPPGRFLTAHIEQTLAAEELPLWTFGKLDPDAVQLAKTASRTVLGCMTDQAFFCEVAIGKAGGLGRLDVADLNHRLHRHIHLHLDGYPIDLARARLTVS